MTGNGKDIRAAKDGKAPAGNRAASNGKPTSSNGKPTKNGKAPKNGKPAKRAPGFEVLQRPARMPSLAVVTRRFGPVLGKRFTRNNLEVLAHVHAAYAGLKRATRRIRGRVVNIFTQWVGDPDALGSAILLKAILLRLGAKEVRILTGAIGHPQNRNMVTHLGLELHDPNTQRFPRGLHCMVDTSPPLGLRNTGPVQPVSEFFFVADHHADPDEVEESCRLRGVKRVRLAFLGLPVGSTSSFMAALGMAFGIWDDLGPAGRAAVALGIYTDTSALLHGATVLDFRMFEKLTRDGVTQDVLDDLRDYRVPSEWFAYRARAYRNQEATGAVRIAPIGRIRESHRDVIAEIANELLRIEGTSIAIAVAVTERGTEVSVRADSRLLGADRGRIVRVIEFLLAYAFPGVSGFKYEKRPPHRVEGGACVPHDEAQRRLWALSAPEPPGGSEPLPEAADPAPGAPDPMLDHCRACAKALVAALQDLKFTRPDEIQGLL